MSRLLELRADVDDRGSLEVVLRGRGRLHPRYEDAVLAIGA